MRRLFPRHIISLNDFGGVINIFDGDVHSGEQFFSDESRVMLFRADERYAAKCIVEHDPFGGGVMVWAGIHHDGRTALVRVNGALNAQIYRDEILVHHDVLLINVTGSIFQRTMPYNTLHESADIFYRKQRS